MAGENVDVSELVFGPGRHGDMRFAEDQDACRSVGLERLNQLGGHGAAEQACGFPHTGHDLFRRWCGVSASGYVEDCMDHRLAVLARAYPLWATSECPLGAAEEAETVALPACKS